MNRDHLQGGARHLKGRAQTVVGGLTGDPARQIRGAVNQVAGGAQYAYGQARDRAEDLYADGTMLAREARRQGGTYGRQALHYADTHRTSTLLGIAALAFAAGWLSRR
ncbi:CsbD family protein [Methylobacterium sp. ID0610]|uniref:CsbD family protein n=1 Tax=Methylobacterium carpenticola TaxID=3344827 RepID=UPI0036953497